jgi:C_GCAxxG_C_C family probable redox protein
MVKEERIELAAAAFNNEYNCAQAVIMAFSELLEVDRGTIIKQAVGFGGGMGRLQEVCGAVTGGIMVIGLHVGSGIPKKENKEFVYKKVQELGDRFRARWGTIKCNELLGVNLRTEEGQELHSSLFQKNSICHKCVANAVEIVDDILLHHKGHKL